MMVNIPAKFHRQSLSRPGIEEERVETTPQCYGAPKTPSIFRVHLNQLHASVSYSIVTPTNSEILQDHL